MYMTANGRAQTKIDAEWLARVVKGTAGLGEAPPAGRPTGRLLREFWLNTSSNDATYRTALPQAHGSAPNTVAPTVKPNAVVRCAVCAWWRGW